MRCVDVLRRTACNSLALGDDGCLRLSGAWPFDLALRKTAERCPPASSSSPLEAPSGALRETAQSALSHCRCAASELFVTAGVVSRLSGARDADAGLMAAQQPHKGQAAKGSQRAKVAGARPKTPPCRPSASAAGRYSIGLVKPTHRPAAVVAPETAKSPRERVPRI
jgi:hypothetical protein